jgi:TatD DNase family protein
MDLVDIGVNLAHRSFGADFAALIGRAREAGVQTLVATGSSLAGSHAVAALTRPQHIYATAGVHPHNAKELTEEGLKELETLLQRDDVVAVGECGLDFNRNYSPPKDQERAFEMQLELAVRVRKPMFLHERDASKRLVEMVRRHRGQLVDAVVHCFTGTLDELKAYLDLDLHIGITGWICDEKRGKHLLELMPVIPSNRLMLETDAPFLTPHDLPGYRKSMRNEPAFLPWVVNKVAQARGVSAEELACVTTQTARAFFRLPIEGN